MTPRPPIKPLTVGEDENPSRNVSLERYLESRSTRNDGKWTADTVAALIYDATIPDCFQRVADAHNAALTTERQRRPAVTVEMFLKDRAQLLAAQAAIEKHNKTERSFDCYRIKLDLSLLHAHDTEVRNPMVDLLLEIRELMPDATMKDLKDHIDALSKEKDL